MSMSPWADESASSSTSPPQLDTENGRSIKGAGTASATSEDLLQKRILGSQRRTPEPVLLARRTSWSEAVCIVRHLAA